MLRRTFTQTLAGSFGAAALHAQPPRYEPTWESLMRHQAPAWFQDAKLGIFIHWGLYSVPAWAPPSGELGKVDRTKWFYQNPYAEWYLNSIRLKESATYKHHVETYGGDFDYYRFAETFNKQVQQWRPDTWADLFQKTGARYVVLTTKHHDGFTLWPSRVPNPKRPAGLQVKRDLVGELTTAVRGKGLKMGLYYSGGLDWTFETRPIAQMPDLRATIPQSEEYGHYVDAHWRELIERYQPSVLWNDIGYPKTGNAEKLFADYYNRTSEGLVNNRFSAPHFDFTTPEYARYDKITEKKWESCRGLGFSFGYNQVEGPEQVIAPDKLIALFVDIVSKNGNLLLNIGPKPDGSISDIQMDRLRALGAWLSVNGEGIFGSKPWVRPQAGENVRFTKKGDSVYAFVLQPPRVRSVTIPQVVASDGMKVEMLGGGPLAFSQKGRDLEVTAPEKKWGPGAVTLKMTPSPYQLVRE
jgi:alpha-L-fucosidase